jgi:hypothetical protein
VADEITVRTREKTRKTRRELPAEFSARIWKKGESGNPGGRPKTKPLTEALECLMGESYPVETLPRSLCVRLGLKRGNRYTWAEVAARYLMLGLQTGKGGVAACFKEVAERLEGKVTLPVEVTSPRDGLDELSEEELKTYIETGHMPAGRPGKP